MKAVNLLPERNRPRAPTGARGGSSYIVLGALAFVLLGAVVYVLTLNSINSSKDQIAAAKAETARDNALADQLGAYGSFDKVKSQRVSSVEKLAQGRFDWERMTRELARVLPAGVWVTNTAASDGTTSSGSAPAAASGSAAAPGSPTLALQGCAPTQSQVAVTLVRLHELQGASDVTLQHSQRPVTGGGSAASGSGGSGGCGQSYSFTANVTFTPQATATSAPAYLGGGS